MPLPSLLLALRLVAPAQATDCGAPLDALLDEVLTHHREAAYLCLAERDEAGAFLVDQVDSRAAAGGEAEPMLTRALAIHLLQRLDREITAEESRALAGADRRFLRDGIHARRGRQSPIPMNDKVFRKFAWYQPDRGYSPKRLSALDQANLAMIDRPPAPPAAAEAGAAAAMAEAAGAETDAASTGCGGAAAGAGSTGLWVALAGAIGLRRRRQGAPA